MPHRKRLLMGLLLTTVGLVVWVTAAVSGDGIPPAPPSASDRPVIATSRPVTPSTAPPITPPVVPTEQPAVAPARRETVNVSSRAFGLAFEVVGPTASAEAPSYEIVVTNPGALTVSQVRVEDQLPAGAKLGSTNPPAEVQGERMSWTLGSLEGHAERRIRVTLRPGSVLDAPLMPTATFTAGAVAPQVPVDRAQVSLPVAPAPAMLVVTPTAPEAVRRGETVPIRITVTNPGTAALTSVKLSAQLPPGLHHPAGSAIESAVGTLAAGETKTVSLDVVAAEAGSLVAELTADADGGRHAEARLTIKVAEAPTGH